MPQLPLKREILDQVTLVFNRLRAEKFEADSSRTVFAQFSLHGESTTPNQSLDATHAENVCLARPFRIGLWFFHQVEIFLKSLDPEIPIIGKVPLTGLR